MLDNDDVIAVPSLDELWPGKPALVSLAWVEEVNVDEIEEGSGIIVVVVGIVVVVVGIVVVGVILVGGGVVLVIFVIFKKIIFVIVSIVGVRFFIVMSTSSSSSVAVFTLAGKTMILK